MRIIYERPLYFASVLFFQTPSSEDTELNSIKLCHIFRSELDLKMDDLGFPPLKCGDQKLSPILGRFYDDISTKRAIDKDGKMSKLRMDSYIFNKIGNCSCWCVVSLFFLRICRSTCSVADQENVSTLQRVVDRASG